MILYINLCPLRHRANGFEKKMRKQVPGTVESLYNLSDLKKRLQASIHDIDALVLDIGRESPISDIIKCQNDLKDLSVILILNDITSDRQIEQLLKLYPRYMTFGTGDDTIISVLQNRMKQKKSSDVNMAAQNDASRKNPQEKRATTAKTDQARPSTNESKNRNHTYY